MSAYPDDGELTIDANGVQLSGWQAIRLTRGVERCPSDFDIAYTEKFPGSAKDVPVRAGDVCRVKIGKDLVLTGYVDRVTPSITAEGHEIRLMGRSACEDLVDSSVDTDRSVHVGTNIRQVAEKLCAPFGIKVKALAGDGPGVPQVIVNLGETSYQVIETLARYSAMLVYDDVEGNLVLSQVGKEAMGSGFKQGQNVLAASVEIALDQRFTEYHAYRLSTISFSDINGAAAAAANEIGSAVVDPWMKQTLQRPDGQPRVRRLAIISEQVDMGRDVAVERAKWECARRAGRSQMIRVTADSWRDAKGKLWEPNYRAKVALPACKVSEVELVIGEVTYLRDEQGTRADLILMPPEAYVPEPAFLGQYDWQIHNDLYGRSDRQATNPDLNPRRNDPAGGV